MIIVTGTVVATPETFDEIVSESVAHVRRSRLEPGCLAHHVYRDVEEPLRLFFYEEWADRAALDVHFRVPDSGRFVEAVTALAAQRPTITIREAPSAAAD
ncbi:MAG TPA: putative quinol monooxygenase [Acidimicrobiia bacterium]